MIDNLNLPPNRRRRLPIIILSTFDSVSYLVARGLRPSRDQEPYVFYLISARFRLFFLSAKVQHFLSHDL